MSFGKKQISFLLFPIVIFLNDGEFVQAQTQVKTFNLQASKSQEVKKAHAVRKLDLDNFNLYHGNTKQAIESYKTAILLNPDLWQAHYGLANCYVAKRLYDAAIEEYQEVLSIKPNNKDAHLNIGNLLKAQGRLEESLKYYKRAQDLGLVSAGFYTSFGLTLAQANRLDEAIVYLEKAQSLNKKKSSPDIFLGKGVIFYKQGEKEKALELLDLAIKKSGGKNAQARNFKAEILYSVGKIDAAKAEYLFEINHEDALPSAFQALGNIYLQENKIDEAFKIFEKGHKWYPRNSDILLGKAVCLEKQNRIADSIIVLNKAIALSKNKKAMAPWIKHVSELQAVQSKAQVIH